MSHRTQLDQQRQDVAALYAQYAERVYQVVAAALRPADAHQAEDLAQDVWVTVWQYVLRGNVIDRPAGLLATMARHRVVDHYRSARVRREIPTDPHSRAGNDACPVCGYWRCRCGSRSVAMQGRELVTA